MNFSSITWIINILIVIFLTSGILWGVRRGALKSFVRLSFLILNCIFWLIITPQISHFILNIDLYPILNVAVGEQTFTTLGEVTNYFLSTNQIVLEFAASSPIIATFLSEIPNIVANFVVFISGYFLLKILTLPIYAFVVNRIIKLIQKHSKNKLTPNKKNVRSRVFGAVFGLMQSALTGMVLFLPLSALSIVLSGTETQSMFSSGSNLNITQNVMQTSAYEPPNTPNLPSEHLDDFINIYYNTMLSNTLTAMNLNSFNEFLFNKLSTIYVNDLEISLAEELKNVNQVLKKTTTLLEEHHITDFTQLELNEVLQLVATVDYHKIDALLEQFFNLKSLRVIGDDVLDYIYQNSTTNGVSLKEQLSTLPEPLYPIVNNITLSIQTGNINLLKEDVLSLFEFVKVLQKNGLLNAFKNPTLNTNLVEALKQNNEVLLQETLLQIVQSILQELAPLTEQQMKENLISPLFASNTIRRITPNLANLTLEALNSAFQLNIERVNRFSVSWSNETSKLASLIYFLKEATINLPLNQLDELDFITLSNYVTLEHIGKFLNTLRESQLFSYLYENTITQLFEQYLIPENEPYDSLQFEFISISDTNWQEEFQKLDVILNSARNLMLCLDCSVNEIDVTEVTLLLDDVFDSNLIKEMMQKAKNLLPELILSVLDDVSVTQNMTPILNNIQISLQQMSVEQVYDDLLIFTQMLEVLYSSQEEGVVNKLLALNNEQISSLLIQFNSSYIGTRLLPQSINLLLAKINELYSLNISYLPDTLKLSNYDINKIASALEKIKQVYEHYTLLDETQKQNEVYDLKQIVTELEIEQIGVAINELKSIYKFKNIYYDVLDQVLFNEQFIKSKVQIELLTYLQLSDVAKTQINWELEFGMIKQGALIGLQAIEIEEFGYHSIRVDEFLAQFGESKLLKLGFINVILSLYPDTNIAIMEQLDLTKSATSIGGIAEAVFQFIDFKYNGTVSIDVKEKYRIREGIKQIDSNETLLAFMEELSQISGINYQELVPLVDTLCFLLEGKEFSVNELSKYLNVAPLIPWLIDLLEKISQGYKMPYYLNVYMQVDLFSARIKLYGIHLGKQVSTNQSGETTPIESEQIVNIMKNLSLVPSFITAQFVYDPTFEQPPKEEPIV
jgi:hypothetical protein